MNTAENHSHNLEQVLNDVKLRITANKIDVPMLPEVAGKVVRLTQDPESDASELSKLIQSDQTLAGHVMRVANSAAYSPNATLLSLQQAITRLGMRVISEIALAASINSTLFNTPGYETYIQHILKCSLAAGLWSKEAARACRKNVEAAFLAGLLNDIGRPVAVQTALEAASTLSIVLSKADITYIEQQTKCIIGLNVLEKWEMPSAVKEVVEYFDHYQDAHPGQTQTMIVVAGSNIARHFYCDTDEALCPTLEDVKQNPVFGDINLYQDDVIKLLEREEAVRSAMEAMGL